MCRETAKKMALLEPLLLSKGFGFSAFTFQCDEELSLFLKRSIIPEEKLFINADESMYHLTGARGGFLSAVFHAMRIPRLRKNQKMYGGNGKGVSGNSAGLVMLARQEENYTLAHSQLRTDNVNFSAFLKVVGVNEEELKDTEEMLSKY